MEHQETIACDCCRELFDPSQLSSSYWVNSLICESCIEEMEDMFEEEDRYSAQSKGDTSDWYESVPW